MRVQYTTWLHPFTSAGVICLNVVKELTKMGIDVSINPLNPQHDPVRPQDYSPEVQQALNKGFRDDVINIFFSYPDSYPHVKCKVNVGYTGADTTKWYQSDNQQRPEWFCNEFMNYMLTPSGYSRNIMQLCGVNIPIFIYPHGINLDLFKPIKREKSHPFTCVYAGELTKRKGTQDLIKAWIEAFGNFGNSVRLFLRANTHMMYLESEEIRQLASQNENIVLHWKNEGQEDLVNYLNQGHVFVYPSRADWYGMIPFEALATGMPVIATDTNGYFEFLSNKIIKVRTSLRDIGDQHPYFKGQWNDPDKDSLIAAMYKIVDKYQYYSEKAYDDAFEVREQFSWKNVTETYLMPFLDKIWKKHFISENKNRKFIKISDLIKNS